MTAKKLDQKVAIVTGGSRGIGLAVSTLLADAGADIAIGFRVDTEAAAESARIVKSKGSRAALIKADVADRAGVKELIRTTVAELGRIDILINCAGILQQKPFDQITDDDWDATMATNLRGTFACCQEVLPVMLEQGSGRIITLASSGGQLGGTLAAHYAASKAGVISLTRSLARLGAPTVTVNCIAPGLIETDMTAVEINSPAGRTKISEIPLQRAGTAWEVAEAALFLCSSANYVTGQTFNVNGGLYLG
jgi:acetoacetyl-CoA reductase/3-oxoacyl-[acyl-carrier protein] reductase